MRTLPVLAVASLMPLLAAIACGGSGSSEASADGGAGSGGSSGGGPSGSSSGGWNDPDAGLPDAGPPLPTCDPGSSDVAFVIDATASVHRISPYIYGTNRDDAWNGDAKNLTLGRAGGNRWTAYDWANNASNAGSDWNYSSDNYLGGGNVPGAAIRQRVSAANAAGAGYLATIPIQGWVAADENGPAPVPPANLTDRFKPSLPAKGAPFVYPPANDGKVYEDELVSWLESQFPSAHTDPKKALMYLLDNEPDLWSTTHPEIQTAPATYADVIAKSIATATAIKKVAPKALVLGPVSYGWEGYVSLQNAPDANGRDFLETYLTALAAASASAGTRLLDSLDLHWYPEQKPDGATKISDDHSATPSDAFIQARVQAPRSLWDPTYVEPSWIPTALGNQAVNLIPRMQAKIAAKYPGTALSFSEYEYGGANHISGAIAEADVLGIFGKYGVFAATQFPTVRTSTPSEPFTYAGFAAYRNYDSNLGTFGDTSIGATTTDAVKTSVYASLDTSAAGKMVLVAINKTNAPLKASFKIAYGVRLKQAAVYQITSAKAAPVKVATPPTPSCQAFVYSLPAMSVSTIVLD